MYHNVSELEKLLESYSAKIGIAVLTKYPSTLFEASVELFVNTRDLETAKKFLADNIGDGVITDISASAEITCIDCRLNKDNAHFFYMIKVLHDFRFMSEGYIETAKRSQLNLDPKGYYEKMISMDKLQLAVDVKNAEITKLVLSAFGINVEFTPDTTTNEVHSIKFLDENSKKEFIRFTEVTKVLSGVGQSRS